MIIVLKIRHCLSILFCVAACSAVAGTTNEVPKFDEVYQLLRTHLNGANEAELNRAAVQGLLAELKSSAMLVGATDAAGPAPAASALGKSIVYDDSYACFQVLKVDTNLAGQLTASYRELAATNKSKIKGVILDLRFAGGTDFAAAAAAADCFLNSDQPLLECGGVMVRSTKKDNAIAVPLAALINAKTSEAAEGLAALLRQTGTGLLLGSESAGRAFVFKEFPLSDGGQLRIAVGEIKMGDGSVFRGGIKPDIAVKTNPGEEKTLWEHPYQMAGEAGKTNADGTIVAGKSSPSDGVVFRRFNEAELVREQREGADLEAEFGGGGPAPVESNIRIVRDPVLSRALDLLKGLAVIQKPHPG
jgi:C-terminal processing protease CtpA/Prc